MATKYESEIMSTKEAEKFSALRSANKPKQMLDDLAVSLDDICPRKAASLRTIIVRLEQWQNSR